MATIYAYKFNNYYNRRLKLNLNDDFIFSDSNVNFNPNDNVDTNLVVGRQNNSYNGDCDYLVYSEDNLNITSRWFIIEQSRKLRGQYQLTLHRDLLADNWDSILDSECLIEKAILPDSNPLIYNTEQTTFNQIKTSETLLKDETGCAWIVGYIAANTPATTVTITANTVSDINLNHITDWQFYDKLNTQVYSPISNQSISVNVYDRIMGRMYEVTYNLNTSVWRYGYVNSRISGITTGQLSTEWNNATNTSTLNNAMNASITDPSIFLSNYSTLNQTVGKVIKDTTEGFYYRVDQTYTSTNNILNYTNAALRAIIQSIFVSLYPHYTTEGQTCTISPNHVYAAYGMIYNLEQVAGTTNTLQIPDAANRFNLKDAPFDMFCIPYSDTTRIKNTGSGHTFSEIAINKSLSMTTAQTIGKALGSYVYDIQLVPYCPMTGFIIDGDVIDINTSSSLRYDLVVNTSNVNSNIVLWSTASSFSKNINYEIPITNKKLQNQCDMWRLVSPNGSGNFQFNAAKNNGVLLFNIDIAYKPIMPYIHISPVFSGLYGNDFNDYRGLICGGDFSVSYLSDAWQTFTINNKNYNNSFNREIENLEYTNKQTMIQSGISAIAGSISGAATGALIGGGIGGGIGGALSLGAGVADQFIQRNLQNEALDYKKDMFSMQLDNIKALPYSLSKTTAFNDNNKLFPILEYYTCTEEEKVAFAQKIAWNSMSVGVIGKLSDYVGYDWNYGTITDKGYIKAKLIRLENVSDDWNYINSIASELDKGVYSK